MLYYMAPLEGITTYIFRETYHRHFAGFDRYFTPFLASKKLSWKEKNEILPEHNEGMVLIPQILANNTETFLSIADMIKSMGYETVNLNLGCPSGTVVSRKRGAGQLGDTYALDRFLDEIFSKCPIKISIKTRVGMSDTCEWEDILEVYKKYPIEELIVHPRLRDDYYSGKPRLETFEEAVKTLGGRDNPGESKNPGGDVVTPFIPLCYNGDIVSAGTMNDIKQRFPELSRVMIGRGILKNPLLLEDIRKSGEAGSAQNCEADYIKNNAADQIKNDAAVSDYERLEDFFTDLCDRYVSLYGPGQDRNVLFKLKDLWTHFGLSYPEHEKALKNIRKADSVSEYRIAVKAFFREM